MKKLLFFIVIALFFVQSNLRAQVFVNGKNINQMREVVYIELILDNRAFQRQPFAIIDYGQLIRPPFTNHRISDERGNDKKFNGEMDIFNFLYRNGWVHETTYSKEAFALHIFKRRSLDKDGLPNLGN